MGAYLKKLEPATKKQKQSNLAAFVTRKPAPVPPTSEEKELQARAAALITASMEKEKISKEEDKQYQELRTKFGAAMWQLPWPEPVSGKGSAKWGRPSRRETELKRVYAALKALIKVHALLACLLAGLVVPSFACPLAC